MNFYDSPHRRFNPLTGEWILVSPHRTKRPWQGQVEEAQKDTRPEYDPKCYLCPGNKRAGDVATPAYTGTYVFDNDFAALLPDVEEGSVDEHDLFKAKTESGVCRVICFSPRHDLTLSHMRPEAICGVVDTWIEQYKELGAMPAINHVQIFENRGAMMGCSNPHPHGQIWANHTEPVLPAAESRFQKSYFDKHGARLLVNYVEHELEREERIVFANDSFVALVPYWAVWPFETMLLPRKPITDITQLSASQRTDCADALRRMSIRFDNLFKTSFPYSMGIHQRPTDGNEHPHWQLHFHYYPPLLRSATVRKFMVGYEMLGMPQRDITAEQAAARLRECSETHYLQQ